MMAFVFGNSNLFWKNEFLSGNGNLMNSDFWPFEYFSRLKTTSLNIENRFSMNYVYKIGTGVLAHCGNDPSRENPGKINVN